MTRYTPRNLNTGTRNTDGSFLLSKNKKRKKTIKTFSAIFFILTLILTTYFYNSQSVQGTSFTFNQTSWVTQTSNTANHTSNQTGWNQYSAKDANLSLVNGNNDLQLTPQLGSSTQTNDTHFTGGTNSNTAINGTGDAAMIRLATIPWLNGWNYRRTVTVTNTSGSSISNYQTLVQLDTASLISAGKLQSNCNDIRFTGSNGTTLLDYWIEGGCNTATTQVWVTVTNTIPASQSVDIYFYYNNAVAPAGTQSWSSQFILMNNASCPANWTRFSALDSKFPQGATTYGGTGGTSTHLHVFSGTTGTASSGTGGRSGADTPAVATTAGHSYSGNTGSTNNLPPYLDMVFCGNSNLVISANLISLFSASVPSGWTRFSALDSKFPQGATTYGGTGGTSTHSHSFSGTTGTSSVSTIEYAGVSGNNPSLAHTHSYSGTTASTEHIPPYLNMVFGQKSAQGIASSGLIAITSIIPPQGWTRFSALDSKFPQGATTYGGTGGTSTHLHGFSGTTGSPIGSSGSNVTTGSSFSSSSHNHSYSGDTVSAGHLPPYLDVIFIQRNSQVTSIGVGSESASPYFSSGTFTSSVMDMTSPRIFTTLGYTRSLPTNTTFTMDIRAGNTATPDGSWTSWQTNIANNGSITALNNNRYVQYRGNFGSTDTSYSPSLEDVTVNYQTSYPITEQTLTSNVYNSESTNTGISKIQWTENLPSNTDVKFQIRTSPNGSSSWTDWCGPDNGIVDTCDSATHFTDPTGNETIDNIHRDKSNDQYFQYKVTLLSSNGVSTPTLSDVTLTYTVVDVPSLTTNSATLITAISARGNGNITATGGENPSRHIEWGTSTGTYTQSCSAGTGSTGTYFCDMTGLNPGTTYFYRAYAVNSAGRTNGSEMSFTTIPGAPTNVQASDGTDSTKIVITWTKPSGATGYRVYRDNTQIGGDLGDINTYDDSSANAPTITPGSATASDGTSPNHISLSVSGASANNGSSHTYKVVAFNTNGQSADSSTNDGYRGTTTLTYQWQRSSGDSDSGYSNISGATTASYNDTNAPANGDGRYYKAIINMNGASQQITATDRGYRMIAPSLTTNSATLITAISARGNGNITATGGENPSRHIEWGTSTGTYTQSCSAGTGSTGTYFCDMTGLNPGTTYFYRAYAVNSAGRTNGEEFSFDTLADNASITTNTATDIKLNAATLNGNIINTGGENPSRRLEWGTTAGTYTQSCNAGTGSTGTYSCEIVNLNPETRYYYRAFAINSAGRTDGEELSFETLPINREIINPDGNKIENAYNLNYLSIPSGTLTSAPSISTIGQITFSSSNHKLILPQATQVNRTEIGNLNFKNFQISDVTETVKQTFSSSKGAVKIGISGEKLAFTKPVTLTIEVNPDYNGQNMRILYQNEGETNWNIHKDCLITDGQCVFTTIHATIYTVNEFGNMLGETATNINVDITETITLDCNDDWNLGNLIPNITPAHGNISCQATSNANGGFDLAVKRDDTFGTMLHSNNTTYLPDKTDWDGNNSEVYSNTGLAFRVKKTGTDTIAYNQTWWGNDDDSVNAKYAGFPSSFQNIVSTPDYSYDPVNVAMESKADAPLYQRSGAYIGTVTMQAVTKP